MAQNHVIYPSPVTASLMKKQHTFESFYSALLFCLLESSLFRLCFFSLYLSRFGDGWIAFIWESSLSHQAHHLLWPIVERCKPLWGLVFLKTTTRRRKRRSKGTSQPRLEFRPPRASPRTTRQNATSIFVAPGEFSAKSRSSFFYPLHFSSSFKYWFCRLT